jgi:TldD protein
VAVATSEGEVAEDRRDWIAFSARLEEEGRGGAAWSVSEGGGARDAARLRAVHPPEEVGARLARALLEQRDAVPPPSGETTVVLAPGPGGVFFHEACGHALEGDRALKGRSALVELLGERVGPADLTLVDDPTLAGLPGSRRMDDEGWPAARTVLIESGRLVGLLLDRATAMIAGTAPTGSARRESYRDLPTPRMSNTFVLEGPCAPEEILASVARGVYVTELGAGEVDTATGDFTFRVRRGRLLAGGRAVAPMAPAVISGNGVAAVRGVSMIGSDLRFDSGAGECGKEGQRLRAAVGQPTIKVLGLAVRPVAGR